MWKLLLSCLVVAEVSFASYPITPVPNSCEDRLMIAVQKEKNLQTVKTIIETEKCNVNAEVGYGETALLLAAFMGFEDVVKYLIGKGAKIDPIRQTDHATPLLMTLETGKLSMAKLLLENGADANFKNRNSESSLYVAARLERLDSRNIEPLPPT